MSFKELRSNNIRWRFCRLNFEHNLSSPTRGATPSFRGRRPGELPLVSVPDPPARRRVWYLTSEFLVVLSQRELCSHLYPVCRSAHACAVRHYLPQRGVEQDNVCAIFEMYICESPIIQDH